VDFTAGQDKVNWVAKRIDRRVYFRVETTPGTP
jgi:hypothetical protein